MYYLHGHIVSGICMIRSIQHHNLQFRSYLVLSPLFPAVSMHHHTHTCNIYDIKGKMFSGQESRINKVILDIIGNFYVDLDTYTKSSRFGGILSSILQAIRHDVAPTSCSSSFVTKT